VLIEELKNEDIQLRLNAIRRLGTIAKALGVDKTRADLIPFLNGARRFESVSFSAKTLCGCNSCAASPVHPTFPSLIFLSQSSFLNGIRHCEVSEITPPTPLRPLKMQILELPDFCCHFPRSIVSNGIFMPNFSLSDSPNITCAVSHRCGFFDPSECLDDEDEVLMALAEELGNFVDHVGGAAYAHVLLQPLESLAAVEETVVRDKAVEAILKVAEHIPNDSFEVAFLPMLKRLSTGDWFTPRSSACGLYALVYPRVSDGAKPDLRQLYGKLCNDDTPMVRRAAASNFKKFVVTVDKAQIKSEMIPIFQTLARDDQDSVRLLAVENCIAIASKLDREDTVSLMLPVVHACVNDKSWRVRYMVADQFSNVCNVFGQDIARSELVGLFVKLLKDSEAEVRTAAASKVTGVALMLEVDTVIKQLLPCVHDLVTDDSQHARASLASDIMGLAPLLGKDLTATHLLELFLQLLKDDFPEVRYVLPASLSFHSAPFGF
jgi:HEAT repeat protein